MMRDAKQVTDLTGRVTYGSGDLDRRIVSHHMSSVCRLFVVCRSSTPSSQVALRGSKIQETLETIETSRSKPDTAWLAKSSQLHALGKDDV